MALATQWLRLTTRSMFLGFHARAASGMSGSKYR